MFDHLSCDQENNEEDVSFDKRAVDAFLKESYVVDQVENY